MVAMELTEAEALAVERKRKRSERPSTAALNYWRKHFYHPNGGCMLCGNQRLIPSTYTQGRRVHCMCPDGQKLRIDEAQENYRPPRQIC
jgi:hypothetical protein